MSLIYSKDGVSFVDRRGEKDSAVQWDYPPIAELCKGLISDKDALRFFLNTYVNLNPPLLLTDPSTKFNKVLTNNAEFPFPKSKFFDPQTLLIFREDDDPGKEKFRQLAEKLSQKKVLEKDIFSLIECYGCGTFCIGPNDPANPREGYFCTKCGKPAWKKKGGTKGITSIFHYTTLVSDVFRHKGLILEGILFQQIHGIRDITNRFSIHSSIGMQIKNPDGTSSYNEKDLVLIDRENLLKPIVVLATTSAKTEKEQVQDSAKSDVHIIHVASNGISHNSEIRKSRVIIFDNILEDPTFPASITDHIMSLL